MVPFYLTDIDTKFANSRLHHFKLVSNKRQDMSQGALLLLLLAVQTCSAVRVVNRTVLVSTRPPALFSYMNDTVGSFVPQDATILWNSVWVWSLISYDIYVSFQSSAFFWFDMSLVGVLSQCTDRVCVRVGCHTAYRGEVTYITSFYVALLTHYLHKMNPVVRRSSMLIFTAAFFMASASLIYDYNLSAVGYILPAFIGAMLGLAKVALYRDVVHKHEHDVVL